MMRNDRNYRRVAFAGDFMSNGQWSSLHLADFGGTFVSPESGNRGDKGVMASLAYIPEVADEEARLVKNDRLRRFVSDEDLEDRSSEWDTEIVDDGVDEDGYPVTAFASVDILAGPKFIALKGTVDEALTALFRKSPKYVVEAYRMAERTGRLDVLNRLPGVVAELVAEGVYSVTEFQMTPMGDGFSAYRVLKGYASTERSVLGDNSGIACRILKILQDGQMRVVA